MDTSTSDILSPMAYSPSELLYTAATATAAYFAYRAFAPPATASNAPPPKGSLQSYNLVLFLRSYRFYAIVSGILQTLFTILHPVRPSVLCPSPANLSPSLFTWNPYTITALGCMLGGGYLRVLAYQQLGKNFTFELARPSRLMTSGLYGYMQHPGYTGGWTCTFGIILYFGRFDGGIGCFVPVGWTAVFTALHAVVVSSVMVFIFRTRVSEEERMLERVFGEEWRAYHRRVKRFIPGVI